jgi:hypothetical protein
LSVLGFFFGCVVGNGKCRNGDDAVGTLELPLPGAGAFGSVDGFNLMPGVALSLAGLMAVPSKEGYFQGAGKGQGWLGSFPGDAMVGEGGFQE